TDLQSVDDDFDAQGHLNNVAAVRYFQDLRIAFVMDRLAPRWTDHLRDHGLVLVARELHVLYETEGMPGERFVGAVRIRLRQGKAGIMEERLVESRTGRAVARAWLVQLLVRDGRAVDYPDWYWDLLAETQGAPMQVLDASARAPWGPPA
ncbi:MAG: thioesterase family protein, partial [Actinobacteria bacterium]|nr:thioesterase family protein [Actinomycetota bacterium]